MLVGLEQGYSNYNSHIQTLNGSKTLHRRRLQRFLTPDGSHLSNQVYAFDLMNIILTPEVRKFPSALDIQLLIEGLRGRCCISRRCAEILPRSG
jgi:hypothetical protein